MILTSDKTQLRLHNDVLDVQSRIEEAIETAKSKGKNFFYLMYENSWISVREAIKEIQQTLPSLDYFHGGMGELKLEWSADDRLGN